MITITIGRKGFKTERNLRKELRNIRKIIDVVESTNGSILNDLDQWCDAPIYNELYDMEAEIEQDLRELLGQPNVRDFNV